jgi:hypothetical protein
MHWDFESQELLARSKIGMAMKADALGLERQKVCSWIKDSSLWWKRNIGRLQCNHQRLWRLLKLSLPPDTLEEIFFLSLNLVQKNYVQQQGSIASTGSYGIDAWHTDNFKAFGGSEIEDLGE